MAARRLPALRFDVKQTWSIAQTARGIHHHHRGGHQRDLLAPAGVLRATYPMSSGECSLKTG
jgi:hypothetical protein